MLALFQDKFPATGLAGLSDGVDLSGWQSPALWSSLGWVKWSCAKVTEGSGYTEPTAVGHSQAALARGIPWGLYHFAKFGDVRSEATRYLAGVEMVVSAVGVKPAFHMLDLEAPAGGDVTVWCEQWCRTVEAVMPLPVVIYTGPSWANSHLTQLGVGLEKRPLWIAHYASAGTTAPWVPALWADWTIWQWTSTPAGLGNLDVNVAKPSWLALLGSPTTIGDDDVTVDELRAELAQFMGGAQVEVFPSGPGGQWRCVDLTDGKATHGGLVVPQSVGLIFEAATASRPDGALGAVLTRIEQRLAALEAKPGGGAAGASPAQVASELGRRLVG